MSEQFDVNNPSHSDGGSLCPSPGPRNTIALGLGSLCFPWARLVGLEGGAGSQAGSDKEAEDKAESPVISDVGCRTGPTGVPEVAGQAEASQISRRTQRLAPCSRAPHTHAHMHIHAHTHPTLIIPMSRHTHTDTYSPTRLRLHTHTHISKYAHSQKDTQELLHTLSLTPSSSQTHM